MDHDLLREIAANATYPDRGLSIWNAPSTPVRLIRPSVEPRWTVEQCADMLDMEPVDVEDWWRLARCRGVKADLFFPERGTHADSLAIRRVCGPCEVAAQCLAFALNESENVGWWGGVSERARREIKAGRPFFRGRESVS